MRDVKFDEYVGKVFKETRESKNMTLVEASESMNMSNQRLSNYELGKRSLSIAEFKMICDFYRIDFAELLNRAYEETR